MKYDGTKFYGRSRNDFVRHHTDAEAIQDATRCFREYVDVHSWVFSKSSFLTLVSSFNQLRLFPFRVFQFQESAITTPDGEPFEFIVTLQKCDYEIPKTWLDARSQITQSEPDLSVFQSTRDLQVELEFIKNELRTLLNSKSWRITKPLRKIRRYFQS